MLLVICIFSLPNVGVLFTFLCGKTSKSHRIIRYPRARKTGLRERESRETKKSER